MEARRQGRARRALVAALIAACGAASASAQGPSLLDLERGERLLRVAREDAAASRRALTADEERIAAALAAARARTVEAEARVAALTKAVDELRARREAAASRRNDVATLRAELEAALDRVKARIVAARDAAAADARDDEMLTATGAPLARRLAAAFHALDRRPPERAQVSVARATEGGVVGRALRVGDVVRYFVPDDPAVPPRFLPSRRDVPAPFRDAVRSAAEIAAKREEPAVVRLPLEGAR